MKRYFKHLLTAARGMSRRTLREAGSTKRCGDSRHFRVTRGDTGLDRQGQATSRTRNTINYRHQRKAAKGAERKQASNGPKEQTTGTRDTTT